ncbi:MAG: Holliday junction branch migration protein RuvA [Bacteroidales bacterium]|nr:Holliday junction branch migration protein RuvA [Bacteroidales bacterium]MDD3666632.1 Holliday junction branch migration protein RuvA [Bacteroidales bacterium]
MFAYIEGTLTTRNPAYVVVDCQGVGYMIHISLNTFTQIKDLTSARLLTHLLVREDAQLLYGFYTEEERRVFRLLIAVSGIGANTARMILSSLSPADLVQAIVTGNEPVLKKIKGIGAKTAQRLIVELKDKVAKTQGLSDLGSASYNTNREEALSALVILGFARPAVEKALDGLLREHGMTIPVEQIIRLALKVL